MPQKQPPASTAVSSPAPGVDASAAGGGMVTADSACAASGLKARAVARSRAEARIMICIPRRLSLRYRDEFGVFLHTNGTRLREADFRLSWPGMTAWVQRAPAPGRDYNLPATLLLK